MGQNDASDTPSPTNNDRHKMGFSPGPLLFAWADNQIHHPEYLANLRGTTLVQASD